jgi:hypothetical protein
MIMQPYIKHGTSAERINKKKGLRIDFLWSEVVQTTYEERQFGVSTTVVTTGKFRNGEKKKGRGVFLTMGVLCGRGYGNNWVQEQCSKSGVR